MSEKRKREDATEGLKKKKVIGPTVQNKPVIYAAPVAYKSNPKPSPGPAPPPTTTIAPAPISTASAIPMFTDPAVYAAVAAASIPKPPRIVPPVKVDDSKKVVPRYHRKAANQAWEDPTLSDWQEDDYRIFCGDLGNEVHDEMLRNAFSKYQTLLRARVVRDKRTGKSKGFGFVSFADAHDFVNALREMNGKYVGNRPVKLKKSNWKDRNDEDKMSNKVK